MNNPQNHNKPNVGFQPQGFWIERLPNGEKLYCHKGRVRGKKIVIKKTLKEIEVEMNK